MVRFNVMEKPNEKLIWTPPNLPASLFFLAFGIFGITVAALAPLRASTLSWLLLAAYICWSFGGLCAVIYNWRARIESDDDGLKWRDWRGIWRAAAWNEIEDFWLPSAKGREKQVRTANGKFGFESVTAGDEGDRLAAQIAARATPATPREWGIAGERMCDPWPRHFPFWRRSLTWAPCLILLVIVALVAWAALAFRVAPRAQELAFASWFLAYIGPLLLVATFPLLLLCVALWSARRAWPWRACSVEVAPDRLVWQGAMRVEVTWAQIESWRWRVRGRTRVLCAQTGRGEIEIPSFIAEFGALCRIIENFSGVELDLKTLALEARALQTVPAAPDGTLVFRFNAYLVQLFCGMFAAFGAMMLLLPWLFTLADPQAVEQDQGLTRFGAFVLILTVVWWIWMKLNRLILSDEAIEWRTPLRRRRVLWDEIESFGTTNGAPWLVVGGRKISLMGAMMWVPQTAQLRAEIAHRATRARGSWEDEPVA